MLNPPSCLVCCLDERQEFAVLQPFFSSVFGIYMNVHSRWCFVLRNSASEEGKHQDKLVHAKWDLS